MGLDKLCPDTLSVEATVESVILSQGLRGGASECSPCLGLGSQKPALRQEFEDKVVYWQIK